MDNFYPDPLDSVMKKLKDAFGDSYRAYYEGDPVNIPLPNLPCIVVEKFSTQYSHGATRRDDVISTIIIKVIMNKRDDFKAKPDVDLTERKLRFRCEARDATTGQYSETSIAGMFRKNLTMDEAVIDSDLEINYDITLRPEEMMTSEAQITLRVKQSVSVPDRQ